MIVKCPICKSEYDCTPGKYQCDCGVKFYVAADGSTSTGKPTMGIENGSPINLRKVPSSGERKFTSRCPYCGNAYQGTEAEIGQVTSCVNCGKQIIIQRDDGNAAAPEPEQKFVSRCPYCGEAYQGTEAEIGQVTSCVYCGKQIIIQRDDGNVVTPKPVSNAKFTSRCPYCGGAYQAEESKLGQVMNCPGCGKSIVVQKYDGNTAAEVQKSKSAKRKFRAGCVMLEVLLLLLLLACFLLTKLNAVHEKRLRKAAEQGDAAAQSQLGLLYITGSTVENEKDYNIGFQWSLKAAEQGNAIGQNSVGYCYGNGYGVKQNYADAVKWYRKAAEQGHATAQANLGDYYENGKGVEKNSAEAVKWYRKAAEQGFEPAKEALKRLER